MNIYQPAEDSYFLSSILEKQIPKLLKKNKELTVLEIGCGSGIQLETLQKLKVNHISGVDINNDSILLCKKLGFNVIKSNLFEKIKRNEKYDLIIFNPPYLPQDKHDKLKDTTGGKKGNETINKFLTQASTHLTNSGKILLLTSSFTPTLGLKGYKIKILDEKPLFFEKLYIVELTI